MKCSFIKFGVLLLLALLLEIRASRCRSSFECCLTRESTAGSLSRSEVNVLDGDLFRLGAPPNERPFARCYRGISSACDNQGFIITFERAREGGREGAGARWHYALEGVSEPGAVSSVALQLYRVTMHRNGGFARLPRSFLVSILVAAAAVRPSME